METIRYCLKNNSTFVIALIMFYENNGLKPKNMYRVLICVLYSLIDNHACIDYLQCQLKTLIRISPNTTFEKKSFNILLGIGIPELLLNLSSCNGFTEKPNAIFILNLRSCLVNYYLAKVLFIIENDSNQLHVLPNGLKLIIHVIDKLETYFVI